MASPLEQSAMQMALREAMKGRPSPNPRVGAAIVQGDRVVALGYHARAGEAHAEVDAIQKAGAAARGATLVVTLEPCNHTGRTGPCTEAIIRAGISRVLVGARDPAPHVPGAVDRLRAAGIDVELGLLREEADALVADFAKHIRTGIPFVMLKAAVTLDGEMSTPTGDRWITGNESRAEVHRMRAHHDAILVGVGTVLVDDPALTVRHVEGPDPLRVVLDSELRTPPGATLVTQESSAPTLIFYAEGAPEDHRTALADLGVELHAVPRDEDGLSLPHVLSELGKRDVVRLFVEGGPSMHRSFLDQNLADRAAVFVAPRASADDEASSVAFGEEVDTIAASWRLERPSRSRFGKDLLITGDVTKG